MSGKIALRFAAILVAANLVLSLAVTAEPLAEAKSAYAKGDYIRAMSLFYELAKGGNAEAEANIGHMYLVGAGVEKNPDQALRWYKAAALKGRASALYWVGYIYRLYPVEGSRAPDIKKAVSWYEKAGGQGEVAALNELAVIYAFGQNEIPKNSRRAFELAQRSAQLGDHIGMSFLARHYEAGEGVLQSYVKALMWYNLSLALREPQHSYDSGDAWGSIVTAMQGAIEKWTKSDRDELLSKMTREQIAEAQVLSERWLLGRKR